MRWHFLPLVCATAFAMPMHAADIVFLGDSLTSGYGLGPGLAYPELIATRIAKEKLPYRVVNAGVSGDTSADGLRRAGKILNARTSVLVIALGANDVFRGHPVSTIESNLRRIITLARKENPEVRILLCGMRMFDELGSGYVRDFAGMFERVARDEKTALLPYLLEGVGGDPALNQTDRIHPTARGQRVMAELVWESLAPLLTSRR